MVTSLPQCTKTAIQTVQPVLMTAPSYTTTNHNPSHTTTIPTLSTTRLTSTASRFSPPCDLKLARVEVTLANRDSKNHAITTVSLHPFSFSLLFFWTETFVYLNVNLTSSYFFSFFFLILCPILCMSMSHNMLYYYI